MRTMKRANTSAQVCSTLLLTEMSFLTKKESENFHFFREVPSRGWKFRRNGLAQHFCDVFMRQVSVHIQ